MLKNTVYNQEIPDGLFKIRPVTRESCKCPCCDSYVMYKPRNDDLERISVKEE